MSEVERIADQLNRAFEGEAWHGPSVLNILDGITAQQAAARTFSGLHNIWEIMMHIAAWERACSSRLAGDRAELPDEEDWPKVAQTTEQAWGDARKALRQAHDELVLAVSKLDEGRLDQPIVAGMSSVYVTLHGVIQHTVYHAGQIAILKKASS